jgi:hypothetical protein
MTLRDDIGRLLILELSSKGHRSMPASRAELDDYLLTAVQALTVAVARLAEAVDEIDQRIDGGDK